MKSKAEYERLVTTARKLGNTRLELIFNTVCSTGIRISELEYFTMESVKRGKIIIRNKGKVRSILLSSSVARKLWNLAIIPGNSASMFVIGSGSAG